jgi:hypothetical protein
MDRMGNPVERVGDGGDIGSPVGGRKGQVGRWDERIEKGHVS